MMMIRTSSLALSLVLLMKVSLFVADDSKFLEIEVLEPIEKRVAKLIDEALRDRAEEKEREEAAEHLQDAVLFVMARKAIVRCVDGVCAWMRPIAHATSTAVRAAFPRVAIGFGAGAVGPENDRQYAITLPRPEWLALV